METKKPVEKKETKSEKVIKSILDKKGFDSHEVISENAKELIVAFGYTNHNHSELIKHNFKSKSNETVMVDGEVSFNEFLSEVKRFHTTDA